MNQKLLGSSCIYCGAIFNITRHHVRAMGKRTLCIVPLCRNCHDDLEHYYDENVRIKIREYIINSIEND